VAAYPVRIDDSASQGPPPDPLDHPEFYEGIVTRRIAAHLLDALLILLLIGGLGLVLVVLGVLTFGLLWLPLVFLGVAIPLAYDTLQVGGRRAATLGMRAFGLEVRSWTGGHPLRPQALLRAVLFWGMSYYTAAVMMWLLLGVALFNRRRRCLHDYFSGTLVIRSRKLMVLEPRSG
jgi:uncharacterized RDD family membrane protein YckC